MDVTISTTETSQFRDCRRKWWLASQYKHPDSEGTLGIENKYPELYFFLGEVVHSALEAFYRGVKMGVGFEENNASATTAFIHGYDAKLAELRKEYGALWGEDADKEFGELGMLGKQMVSNYCMMEFTEPIGGKGSTIEIIEERHFSDWFTTASGIRVRLSGRFDLTLRDRPGFAWIVDHKTAQQKPWTQGIEVDDQLTSYCYLFAANYDETPRGAIYNVLLKALIEIDVLKSGELSKNKTQKCTFGHYYAMLKGMGLSVAKYTDFLEALKQRGWSDFFLREGSPRTGAEIQNYERRLANLAEDVGRVIENPLLAYPNPGQFKCRGCAFVGVCKAMECNEDWEQIVADKFKPRSPRL
jgi:hypothetical protein